jgi:hypothetical protein
MRLPRFFFHLARAAARACSLVRAFVGPDVRPPTAPSIAAALIFFPQCGHFMSGIGFRFVVAGGISEHREIRRRVVAASLFARLKFADDDADMSRILPELLPDVFLGASKPFRKLLHGWLRFHAPEYTQTLAYVNTCFCR